MLQEIVLAIIQSATEFLPISSSGHLALVSNLISESNLFFITMLHIASLMAVLVFTRNEIYDLITFQKPYRKLWLFLIIATIPAGLFGLFFNEVIEQTFSSFLFLGFTFLFTSLILFSTKFPQQSSKLNFRNSFLIGLFQIFALFPGVSRSGMTISAAIFSGIDKQKGAKFSFLLFIPLSLGAFILEQGEAYFSIDLVVAFLVCFIFSLIFLSLLFKIIKNEKFWMFSIYCLFLSIVCFLIYFIK